MCYVDAGRSTSISATQDISFQSANSSYVVNLQIPPEEDDITVDQQHGNVHEYPIPQPNISTDIEEPIVQQAISSGT